MSKDLAIVTDDKIQLLKDQICRGATDSELQLFIANCNRTGLDPFSKQCWAVKRWDKELGREVMAFQTGVDGFRVIANRSEKYQGQIGPFWCGEDGNWKDVWLGTNFPIAAKVAVLRSDFKEPLWAVAKFTSYAAKRKDGSLTPFWSKMPDLMLAKVAECLALRKAFPQDLSGVYSQEEMEQAENNIKEIKSPEREVEQQDKQKQVKAIEQKTIQQPASEPIVNYAPTNEVTIENYRTRFSFGSFKSGLSFAQLGKKDTIKLLNEIQKWKLAKESVGEKIPTICEEFILLAKEYLKRHE